ncbi:bifunctional cytidylyltransferase/SDR family oxidoreductase [Zymomonas mobilis]|uniref:4-diphosphocytidyl-2C-methyl-D-erythritol synthase n=1 Tax=Zymomonas mobilis subsp. pomaceae (strain ATCC 29192 / DSM 22645 / JCM 10191 / CCUG 17912 / NBRC 13757 / NCIMB 11200 / NRRL B-4491 / Barker I) TaxID=579138 RepID=F8ESG9_ZYMMT|nr:bifunctional cytidylyltransferase/SDR family oxidoreductase [Zymomonas mobilis]AEI37744.1 4-diphosphocytidyl-2C-methyl-D-erythritol synthase [Zymomonas mobilis subsp. pomaceae ATCC 29192]MDX5949111.1 bifunctional cytidylyltransferase/SDR family oxidoreductase [Zymomonas mobilis subsp. pomaceae]GEB88918.1 pyrophosphorylase [Zymomonas mobilis subsp. pomaceae]
MAIAVILAGGKGIRFGDAIPKQFKTLGGKPIIQYTIEAFFFHPDIDELIITYPTDYKAEIEKIASAFSGHKAITLVAGGASRMETTLAALNVIGEQRKKVLFHDAVRPFVSHDIISQTILALDNYDAVDVVIPTADTIVEIDAAEKQLTAIPERSRLRRGQTPQGFWADSLKAAYQTMDTERLNHFSDDCGVFLDQNPTAAIGIVAGDDKNIKITTPIDFFLAEQILYSGQAASRSVLSEKKQKKSVIIFGASSGLGAAAIQAMKEQGWLVFPASRSTGVDIRHAEQVQSFFKEVLNKTSTIDAVVIFSGILKTGKITEMNPSDIREMIDVNLVGTINVALTAYPYLKKAGGHLLLVSSSSYFRGRANSAVYSASKAAVVNLTQALSEEWADDNIAVSCIAPRRANTPMRRKAFPKENPAVCLAPEVVSKEVIGMLMHPQTGLIKHIY